MATAILPPPSTTWPSASSRASRPATRTAEGPISTPRRDCPRSSGTPRILIFLDTMLSATTGRLADSGFNSVFAGAVVVGSGVISFQALRINPSQRPRKRNRFPDVLQSTHPGHSAFDAHAKSRMRHAAVLAEIQIPLKGRFRQIMLLYALPQQVVIPDALRPADDLPVP